MSYSESDSKYVFVSTFMNAQTAEMQGKWEVKTNMSQSQMLISDFLGDNM